MSGRLTDDHKAILCGDQPGSLIGRVVHFIVNVLFGQLRIALGGKVFAESFPEWLQAGKGDLAALGIEDRWTSIECTIRRRCTGSVVHLIDPKDRGDLIRCPLKNICRVVRIAEIPQTDLRIILANIGHADVKSVSHLSAPDRSKAWLHVLSIDQLKYQSVGDADIGR